MTDKTVVFAAALLLALVTGQAAARTENLENAYESTIGGVSLPAGLGGTLQVRECDRCKPVSLRVAATTRYFVGTPASPPVALAEFRKATADPRHARNLLTVFYDLKTNTVTRVVLSTN